MIKGLVLIPSYNSGRALVSTVREVIVQTSLTVLVVIDGSNDGSEKAVELLAENQEQLRLLKKERNEGKGAAVRSGLLAVAAEGYTHVLTMDADGQHPAEKINGFFQLAEEHAEAMVLGKPVFDETVPVERLYGRKLSVWIVQLETMSRAIEDPLFGFRIYPVDALLKVMCNPRRSNRYDFDPEVAVRMYWSGVPAINVPAPVKYLSQAEGGVSHFHYLRDNFRFLLLHAKLLLLAPFHWFGGRK